MILKAVSIIFDIVEVMILVKVVLSWFVRDPEHPANHLLGVFVDPIMEPVRLLQQKLGFNTAFLDFTPLFALLLLRVIRFAVLQLLIIATI